MGEGGACRALRIKDRRSNHRSFRPDRKFHGGCSESSTASGNELSGAERMDDADGPQPGGDARHCERCRSAGRCASSAASWPAAACELIPFVLWFGLIAVALTITDKEGLNQATGSPNSAP
jgi:hypothetical protein